MASTGTPPSANPSATRSASTAPKPGMSNPSAPHRVAAAMADFIAVSLPIRSPSQAQGRAPAASPMVAAEISSAEWAAVTCSRALISGRIPWGE